jgi:alpha-tubulin suppressor-like RCC1 family protein
VLGVQQRRGVGGGTTTIRSSPVKIGTATWSSVSAGDWHMCGIQTDGSLWCWGDNSSGKLGDGTTTGRTSPKRIGVLTTWKSIADGMSSTCGILTDRSVWCWGDNADRELGQGDTTNRSTPTRVPNMIGETLLTGPEATTVAAIT